MHKKPQSRGFSLIEMILSIACIALSATIILQLFLVAAYRNERGRSTDAALTYAQTALETFKGTENPTDIIEMEEFGDLSWSETDEAYQAEMVTPLDREDAALRVSATLSPDSEARDVPLDFAGGDVLRSQVFRLGIRVHMISNEKEELLLDIFAKKLFTFREAAQ